MNVNGFIFMFPLGVQFAASGLVGNSLGKGNSTQAKRFAVMCVVVTVISILTFAVSINVWAYPIAQIFTKDEETIDLIVECLPVLSLFIILDAVHGVQAGNVRALGR